MCALLFFIVLRQSETPAPKMAHHCTFEKPLVFAFPFGTFWNCVLFVLSPFAEDVRLFGFLIDFSNVCIVVWYCFEAG